MFIDSHTHLYSSQFDQDRDEVISRALSVGVNLFLLPNIDESSIEGMHALEGKYPNHCFAMMGLHPCSVDLEWQSVLHNLKKHLDTRSYIAIGEIGIDLYWDKTFLSEQKRALGTQLEWAKEMGIPVVIHARDSFNEIFEVIDIHNDERLKGVFHCFTGSIEDVHKIKSYGGFLFGIGGVITFKKSTLSLIVKEIGLDGLILETDSPYLAPLPHRGKRNESAYIPLIASKLADVFEVSEIEIAQITSRNAKQLFQL